MDTPRGRGGVLRDCRECWLQSLPGKRDKDFGTSRPRKKRGISGRKQPRERAVRLERKSLDC